jgi:hypothetical protein
MLETPFWQRAARSLPHSVRVRYASVLERAERLDLALDAAIDTWVRARTALAKVLQTRGRVLWR